MRTNVDRQKVAKALRGDPNDTLIPQTREGFERMTYHEAAYRFWHMCRRIRSAAEIDIAHSTTSWLAKLIDPTCRCVYVKDDDSDYIEVLDCCGCTTTRDNNDHVVAHCPNCGARVVNAYEFDYEPYPGCGLTLVRSVSGDESLAGGLR